MTVADIACALLEEPHELDVVARCGGLELDGVLVSGPALDALTRRCSSLHAVCTYLDHMVTMAHRAGSIGYGTQRA